MVSEDGMRSDIGSAPVPFRVATTFMKRDIWLFRSNYYYMDPVPEITAITLEKIITRQHTDSQFPCGKIPIQTGGATRRTGAARRPRQRGAQQQAARHRKPVQGPGTGAPC